MVIDTMVFAYALLRIPGFSEAAAEAIERSDDVQVPDSFHAEFANVVWLWIRAKHIEPATGYDALEEARASVTGVASTADLWSEALRLSIERNHPVYDSIFVALARNLGTRVVTFDRRLIARFPGDSVSVDDFLAEPPRRRPSR